MRVNKLTRVGEDEPFPMKTLLLLAYHFPPIGGAGVQRPTKFLRHLSSSRYRPVVVTGPGTSTGRWTPHDPTLASDIPAGTRVIRINGPEPPASAVWRNRAERWLRLSSAWDRWWLEGAAEAARSVERIDVAYAFMSPWPVGEAAAAVARARGIPWIADLGDPWALDEMMLYPSAFHRRLDVARMRRVLRSATAVIMSTPEAVERVVEAFPEFAAKTVVAIPNGFDAADFAQPAPVRDDGKFRIVHAGYLHTYLGRNQHLLAPVRGLLGGGVRGVDILTRSHVFLLEAVDRLLARNPGLRSVVEVHLAGVLSEHDRAVAERSPVAHLHGYVPHVVSVELLRSADLLFLPMQNLPDGQRATIVPGKTYEYLAAQRPILAAVPEGDARDILTEAGNALICRPDDVDGMARAIETCVRNKRPAAPVPETVLERFEYGTLVEKALGILDEVSTPAWARSSVRAKASEGTARAARSSSKSRRVLYVAYHFPPIGGAGVQRSLKFVRYLPECGYRPIVVTGPGEVRDRWTPKDGTLSSEIPDEAQVVRVQGLEPSHRTWRSRGERWLRLPSRWDRWWVEGVIAAASELRDVDVIHATLSPWSSAVAAAELARRLGKPWTVGLRDPWALDEMLVYPSGLHRRLELARMRRVLASASAIVMNTPEAAARLVESFPELAQQTVVPIPNGFDAADFAERPPLRSDGKFRIVHSGYLHTYLGQKQQRSVLLRRVLGGQVGGVDILTRSHVYLLKALDRLLAADPALATQLEVHFAGVLSTDDRKVAERLPLVRIRGYLPHDESVRLLQSADLLFLPMQNLPDGQRATVVPGKTYEYLAAERPVLAAVPDGDARDILRVAGNAIICRPDDVAGIAAGLEQAIDRWRRGEQLDPPPAALLHRFERRHLTEELAAVFDTVLAGSGDRAEDTSPVAAAIAG